MKNIFEKTRGLLLFTIVALSLSACFKGSSLPVEEITFRTNTGMVAIKAEVATTPDERSQGLMEREKLESGNGMLFVFEDEAPRSFWMKNTVIPLDILFVNGKNEIVSIIENMEPCKVAQCPSYLSGRPAMLALELPAGSVAQFGFEVGDIMTRPTVK